MIYLTCCSQCKKLVYSCSRYRTCSEEDYSDGHKAYSRQEACHYYYDCSRYCHCTCEEGPSKTECCGYFDSHASSTESPRARKGNARQSKDTTWNAEDTYSRIEQASNCINTRQEDSSRQCIEAHSSQERQTKRREENNHPSSIHHETNPHQENPNQNSEPRW